MIAAFYSAWHVLISIFFALQKPLYFCHDVRLTLVRRSVTLVELIHDFPWLAGHHYNRILVMTVGSFIWGFFAFCFGWANTINQVGHKRAAG